MIIASVTPKELIDWFHSRQESQRVLCILLAPSNEDQTKLTEVIGDFYATDATLGKEVAFLLLHPQADSPLGLRGVYGKCGTIKGRAFPELHDKRQSAYPLREICTFHDMNKERFFFQKEVAEKSSRTMAYFVPDFMNLLAIPQSELPALCVLIKGLNDSVVISIEKDWSPEYLTSLLGHIRNIVDSVPNFRNEFDSFADSIPSKLSRLSETVREIDAKTAKIGNILEKILRRYTATDSDRNLLADFFARGCPSKEQLESVFERLSFAANQRFIKDGQRTKVLTLTDNLEILRSGLDKDLSATRYTPSIAERAEQLTARRKELLKELQKLKSSRLVATSKTASGNLERIWYGLEKVNLSGDLGYKLLHFSDWIRKLLGN